MSNANRNKTQMTISVLQWNKSIVILELKAVTSMIWFKWNKSKQKPTSVAFIPFPLNTRAFHTHSLSKHAYANYPNTRWSYFGHKARIQVLAFCEKLRNILDYFILLFSVSNQNAQHGPESPHGSFLNLWDKTGGNVLLTAWGCILRTGAAKQEEKVNCDQDKKSLVQILPLPRNQSLARGFKNSL